MSNNPRHFWVRVLGETTLCFAVAIFVYAIWLQAFPTVEDGLIAYPDTDVMERETLPLSYYERAGVASVQLSVKMSKVHFTHLRFIPDDCIVGLEVNSVNIDVADKNTCDYFRGFTVNLSDLLKEGKNVFFVQLENFGGSGGLNIMTSVRDPLHYKFIIAIALVSAFFVHRLYKLGVLQGSVLKYALVCLAIAAVIRFLYFVGTTHTERAYDVEGHIDYVNFLLNNRRLPVMGEGWQWYQPPLYYTVLAGVSLLHYLRDGVLSSAYAIMQAVSLVASILTYGVALLIGRRLLLPLQKRSFWLYVLQLIACPALVYFSARINNDVFLLLFSSIALYLLIVWWQTAKDAYWYSAIVVLCLAYISKSNALIVFASAATLLLVRPALSWLHKWSLSWRTVLLLIFCLQWIIAFRLLSYGEPGMVGNATNLNEELRLTNTIEHLAVFNPIKILDHPYADPWLDEERRQYFWEYLFKSALFGEFVPPESLYNAVIVLLIVSLCLTPLILWSFFYSAVRNWRRDMPMLVLTVYILLSHLAFRILYPFSSSQDFRYSVLLVLPASYFAVANLHRCPVRIRQFYTALLLALPLTQAYFLIQLVAL